MRWETTVVRRVISGLMGDLNSQIKKVSNVVSSEELLGWEMKEI